MAREGPKLEGKGAECEMPQIELTAFFLLHFTIVMSMRHAYIIKGFPLTVKQLIWYK